MEVLKTYWDNSLDKFQALPANVHQLEPHYPKAEVPLEQSQEDEEEVE
jgi:hypothetical protein